MFQRTLLLVFAVAGSLVITQLLAAPVASAQEKQTSIAKELRIVQKRIRGEETKLTTVRERLAESEASLEKVKSDLGRLQGSKDRLKDTLIRLERRRRAIESGILASEAKVLEQRRLLEQRVVAMYKMHRRSGSLDYLLQSQSATELLKRARLLGRVSVYDNRRLKELATLIDEFEQERLQLDRLQRQREKHLDDLTSLESELETKTLREASLLDKAKREEQARVRALKTLERSATRLESVLARIMGSTEPAPVTPTKPDVVVDDTPPKPSEKLDLTPFKGRGLARAKGRLPLPLDGVLIQKFGKQRHDEFADMLFIKGMEFRGAVGEKVRAVSDGKVVLNQVLPGYGNVLIVDHGKRYYTLYGRLAGVLKRVGDVVSKGEVVAVLGEVDKKGRNFYFELRIKGKPVNPASFFAEQPRTA